MTNRDQRGRYARRMNEAIRRAAGIRADEPAEKPTEEVQLSARGSWDGGARRSPPAPVDMNERLRQAIGQAKYGW